MNLRRFHRLGVLFAVVGALLGWCPQTYAAEPPVRKIVLIAGPITGHPKHAHEYEKNVILLKHLLDTCPNVKGIKTEAHFKGWPEDEKTLDDADTIVMISDGGDHRETDHPLYVGDRFKTLAKQMARGCGYVQFHWTTFNPSRVHDQITEWVGGYFDYEKGPAANKWFSAIQTWEGPVSLGSPEHPISRGVKPFTLREEFYFNLRFREKDARVKPIIVTRPPGGKVDQTVGWAVERLDGGRGFGFTGGHFYSNWWLPDFRRTVLNAIVWTAKVEVPEGGVESSLPEPTKALIVTGYNHPAHDWRKVTAALIPVIEQDPRIQVEVTEQPNDLAQENLNRYGLIVFNYSNWDRAGLTDAAKQNFMKYLRAGGGLMIVHFANGAFTNTIPNKESDWPEFRTQIVRRIWDHTPGLSGHDAFGKFQVETTAAGDKHEITQGLPPFETEDELYFRQQGTLPIIPLLTAHSKVTKQAEPMAWVYEYGKGRIFQTVLGHADVSIRKAGLVMRRGAAWAANLPPLSFDPPVALTENYLFRDGSQWSPASSLKAAGLTATAPGVAPIPVKNPMPLGEGKFGKGLNAAHGGAFVKGRPEFRQSPITVECWARLKNASSYNILVANELKSSATHWEIFSMPASGELTAYLPGMAPDHVRSKINLCDDKWHHVAMIVEKTRVRLFADGMQVADQAVKFNDGNSVAGDLAIGSLVGREIGCNGLVDEVRISNSIREIKSLPTAPFEADEQTVGLWHFDELDAEKKFPDSSKLKTPAVADVDSVKKKDRQLSRVRITLERMRSGSNGPRTTREMTAGG
ncbi:MAG: Trehalose utilization [Planctomycetaceae bacterium]|nr:Trehalose utilization [Planctomycetaceae bacterium]